MWKAIIDRVSEVDSNGSIEVTYHITEDGVTRYDHLMVTGAPDRLTSEIQRRMSDLKAARAQVAPLFRVGQVIALEAD